MPNNDFDFLLTRLDWVPDEPRYVTLVHDSARPTVLIERAVPGRSRWAVNAVVVRTEDELPSDPSRLDVLDVHLEVNGIPFVSIEAPDLHRTLVELLGEARYMMNQGQGYYSDPDAS